jgi:predicted AAA+ superfamily ATPase
MRYIARLLQDDHVLSTDEFLRFLEQHALASNVNMGDVEQVTFDSLHGVDDVIRQLEVDVIVPLEHSHLAEELQLQPKRGVLLYGPPGTGKTTIGRALAHRLRSKFFLIDGTVISGTPDFFHWVNRIFESAKTNAPSVLFIDDSDLLFENPMEFGLYRYLLTMLDGLASRDNAGVTVILTTMNLGSLPPALIEHLQEANHSGVLLDVYLSEGEHDEAIALVKSAKFYHGQPLERVAKAVESTHPQDAIALYKALAQWQIGHGNRKAYQTAAAYLQEARRISFHIDQGERWGEYIRDLRQAYPRHRALQDELNKAGL